MNIIYSKNNKRSFWSVLREGTKSITKTVNKAAHYYHKCSYLVLVMNKLLK